VFGKQSRWRLPELGLLAGSILSYAAATQQALPTGFWDRKARPTCGRLRRALARANFLDLPLQNDKVRKKASVTAHLQKGVAAHRRKKAESPPEMTAQALPLAA